MSTKNFPPQNWYSYVQHDPVNLRDFLGLAPWNLYSSIKETRDDFGINYNDDSMNSGNGVEFGTTIYQDSISHNYYYSLPNIGDAVSSDSVWLLTDPLSPNDIIVELSHTHGDISGNPEHLSDFGPGIESDIETSRTYNIPISAFAPSGTCYLYDPNKTPGSQYSSYVNSDVPHVSYDDNGMPVYPDVVSSAYTKIGVEPNNRQLTETALKQIAASEKKNNCVINNK